ncbi:MAG: hypothetical protein DMG96_02730 [Acidobacteria bacterium]|nr:MAG: hypothetical protein DMG96_02730 [Acidobacteriota bacterium]
MWYRGWRLRTYSGDASHQVRHRLFLDTEPNGRPERRGSKDGDADILLSGDQGCRTEKRRALQGQRAELRVQAMMRSFSGPLAPPEALERYNQTLPGLAERMIAMVESQHSQRQELEKHVIHANISAQRVGTMLGFIVAVASLVGVFLYSKREQQKDLDKKTQGLADAASGR